MYRWICTYTERGGGDNIWGIHGEYPFAGGDECTIFMILDEWMKMVTKKPNDNHVSILFLYK